MDNFQFWQNDDHDSAMVDARRFYAITETAEYPFTNHVSTVSRYASTSMGNHINASVNRSEFIKVEK